MAKRQTFTLLGLSVLAAGLLACNGENPFKNESNPVKKYPNAMAAQEKYVPGVEHEQPTPPNNDQHVCFPPFSVSLEQDFGDKLLLFAEEESASYKVVVQNLLQGKDFAIEADGPRGSSLKLLKRDGDFATYQLSWKPSRNGKGQAKVEQMTLKYSAKNAGRCAEDSERINLVVIDKPLFPSIVPRQGAPLQVKSQACATPMVISAEGNKNNVLTFVEGQASAHTIKVRSFLGADFKLAVDAPAGLSLNVVEKGDRSITYQLSWTPGKEASGKVGVHMLGLRYSSSWADQNCGPFVGGVNLITVPVSDVPTVSFAGMPSEKITYPGVSPKFQILVNDPASTAQWAPDIQSISFLRSVQSGERRVLVLDGSKAVKCDEKGTHVEGTKWQWTCEFQTQKITGADRASRNAREIESTFFVTAVSKRTGNPSSPTPAPHFKVEFPRQADKPADSQDEVFGPTEETKGKGATP